MDTDMIRITRISFMITNILLDTKCKTIIFHIKLLTNVNFHEACKKQEFVNQTRRFVQSSSLE